MQKFILVCLALLALSTSAQNISISNGTYIGVYGSTKIVQASSSPNSITKTGSVGGIRTDNENCAVIFQTGGSVGSFTVPFVASTGATIPFTYNITSAGTGSGYLSVSTYETPNNNTPFPTGVTQLNSSSFDNSLQVIDRFWVVNPVGYTDKPKGSYTFTYDDNDLVGNTCYEANLFAQRWNSDANTWGDWLYSPTVDPSTNTLQIFIQNPPDQYPVWTLVDQGSPLPITLTLFKADCEAGVFVWETASEIGNEKFIIEGTDDGIHFRDVAWVSGAGYSNTPLHYEYHMPADAPRNFYYRLKQVDYDGKTTVSDMVSGCPEKVTKASIYPNPNNGIFSISTKGVYTYVLMNALGQNLWNYTGEARDFNFTELKPGEYWMQIYRNGYNVSNLRFIKIK